MDKTQLITIIITAVVSITAKELITWLISLTKKLSVLHTIKEKLKVIFNKTNRAIISDILALLLYVAFLIYFALAEGDATRIEILLVIGATIAVLFLSLSLIFKIVKLKIENEKL